MCAGTESQGINHMRHDGYAHFLIISIALFSVTLAVNIQVPLYTHYATLEGRDTASTALMFSMYVAGLMPALVLFGDISSRLGRRLTLFLAVHCALIATLLVYFFPSVKVLMAARLLQGLGVGLAVGTTAAYFKDLAVHPGSSSFAITLATSLGFGGGALLTSTTLEVWPQSDVFSYELYMMFAAIVLMVAVFVAPYVAPKGTSAIRLPAFVGQDFLPHLSIALAWMVSGLLIALVPSQLAVNGQENWIGPALFLVNMAGVLVQPLARRLGSKRSLFVGFVLIPAGLALLIYGSFSGNVAFLLAGSTLAGSACYGFTYLGGMSQVLTLAGDRQAGAVSGFMIFAYIGFALPSLLLGQLSSIVGIKNTLLLAFAIVVGGSLYLAFRQRRNESILAAPQDT